MFFVFVLLNGNIEVHCYRKIEGNSSLRQFRTKSFFSAQRRTHARVMRKWKWQRMQRNVIRYLKMTGE